MSNLIYFLAEHYPWWGIPSALILFELGNSFRRRGKRALFLTFLGMSFFLILLVGLYFYKDGMNTVRPALKSVEDQVKQ